MIQVERRGEIINRVRENGKITIAEICEWFEVSAPTARRDLRDLDQHGLLRRVHGGAVSSIGRSYEPPFQLRSTKNVEAKHAVGCKAAELVFDGDSIALDVGTTTLEVARCLRDRHNITIITSSLPIANEVISNFSLNSEIRLILTGGVVRPGEFSLTGNLAERAFSELHVDKAFIGVGGLSIDQGITEYNIEDAEVKRPLLTTAKKKIVVADSSKLDRITFARIGLLSSIDIVVTDDGAPDQIVEALREKGVEVIVADLNG